MVRQSFIFRRALWIFLSAALCSAPAVASETITGVVVNKTTGKPAAGDDVALLTLDGGSLEVSRGKTAEDGTFRLRSDVLAKHLLRVRHDGVIYQQDVTTGAPPRVEVFDSASTLPDVTGAVTVMRIDSDGEKLNVTELHSIANESKPPRTLANARNLEILLPSRAALDSVVVQAPEWPPEKVSPKPVAAGSRQYAVGYPLRPGTTQFAVKYHLPYSDKATIHARLQYPTKLWTVMFPKSMSFRALRETSFSPFVDQEGMRMQALTKLEAGEVPGFVISGAGSFAPKQAATLAETVPAKLLGAPHFRPDIRANPRLGLLAGGRKPLVYKGFAGFVVLLAIVFVTRRRLSSLLLLLRPRLFTD